MFRIALILGTISCLKLALGMLTYPLNMDLLSVREHSHIDGFRDIVKNDLSLDHMLSDTFLAKWLKESNFELKNAQHLLQENLRWRKLEQIDSILNENWDEMNSRFPYSRSSLDKKGQPVLYFDLGDWDISSWLSESPQHSARLGRYFVKMFEDTEAHVRALNDKNKNVTQFNLLVNMRGYSNSKHACVQCVYFYRNVGDMLSAHYPYSTQRNVFVNVPYLFKTAYSFLSMASRSVINMYGQDENVWEKEVLTFLDANQLPSGLRVETAQGSDNSDGFLFWNIEL